MPQQSASASVGGVNGEEVTRVDGLRERITGDLRRALKGSDAVRLRTLRLLEASFQNEEIARKRARLTEEDLLRVLEREVKRRREAAELYRAGDRLDRADDELREAAVISEYLPPQLTDGELESIVREVVSALGLPEFGGDGAVRDRDAGRVMGAVMAKVRGRAEGHRVRQVLSRVVASQREDARRTGQ